MILLILIAWLAFCYAITETWIHHHSSSIFHYIKLTWLINWTKPDSWKNKYKDGIPLKGPKFFGSTTIFVWVTDMYHFFKLIQILTIFALIAVSIYGDMEVVRNIDWVFLVLFLWATYFVVFEFFYSFALKKRK